MEQLNLIWDQISAVFNILELISIMVTLIFISILLRFWYERKMAPTKAKKTILRVIKKQLDRIHSTSFEIAQQWDKHAIPLTTLKSIIKKSIPQDLPGWTEFIKIWKQSMDDFYKDCERVAKTMDSKEIPVQYIKDGIDIYYETFKNAIEEQFKGK